MERIIYKKQDTWFLLAPVKTCEQAQVLQLEFFVIASDWEPLGLLLLPGNGCAMVTGAQLTSAIGPGMFSDAMWNTVLLLRVWHVSAEITPGCANCQLWYSREDAVTAPSACTVQNIWYSCVYWINTLYFPPATWNHIYISILSGYSINLCRYPAA